MSEVNPDPIAAKALERDALFDKIPVTALLLGAINLIGGAAVARGWLLDIGMRYYDGISDAFEIPRGIFFPSESRIMQAGYGRFLTVAMTHVFDYLPIFVIIVIWLVYFLFFSKRRPTKIQARLKVFCTCLMLIVIMFAIPLAMYEAPKFAGFYGRDLGCGVQIQIAQTDCESCRLYGKDKVYGIGLFSDDKTIFVAEKSGSIVQMPLSDLAIGPQVKKQSTPQKASATLQLTKKCNEQMSDRVNHPTWINNAPLREDLTSYLYQIFLEKIKAFKLGISR